MRGSRAEDVGDGNAEFHVGDTARVSSRHDLCGDPRLEAACQ
jgi:hypothetical protein